MFSVTVSQSWRTAYPGSVAGILVLKNAKNPKKSATLDSEKRELENLLRSQFSSRSELAALPTIQAYTSYYKIFRKNYHVLFQLESIALKGKSIPNVVPIVEAMFIAEIKNQLLTAGHDCDALELPVTLDISKGNEQYIMLNGREQLLKPDDMMMSDARGVISSVIYGPDRRTRITRETKNSLFVVYAPPGIQRDRVAEHLQDIKKYVELFSPEVYVEFLEIFVARE